MPLERGGGWGGWDAPPPCEMKLELASRGTAAYRRRGFKERARASGERPIGAAGSGQQSTAGIMPTPPHQGPGVGGPPRGRSSFSAPRDACPTLTHWKCVGAGQAMHTISFQKNPNPVRTPGSTHRHTDVACLPPAPVRLVRTNPVLPLPLDVPPYSVVGPRPRHYPWPLASWMRLFGATSHTDRHEVGSLQCSPVGTTYPRPPCASTGLSTHPCGVRSTGIPPSPDSAPDSIIVLQDVQFRR